MVGTNQHRVTVFGATGFIGSYLVEQLAKAGYQINIVTRDCEKALSLKPAGDMGQINIIRCALDELDLLEEIISGSDSIIYLPGILFQKNKDSFDKIHHQIPKHIARIATSYKIENYVHMSALGANLQSKSAYSRSKAGGEVATRSYIHNATIIRPSLVFGVGDGFFTKLTPLFKYAPFVPCFYPHAQFQPVSVMDVCHAILQCLSNSKFKGLTFELGGPEIITMRQMLEMLINTAGWSKKLVNMPNITAYMLAIISSILPNPMISFDQIKMLSAQSGNIITGASPSFETLSITPKTLSSQLPYIIKSAHA
ncbi:MAG: complex I NDUFA9 subunit family protein [Pseudomonadota bacterium]